MAFLYERLSDADPRRAVVAAYAAQAGLVAGDVTENGEFLIANSDEAWNEAYEGSTAPLGSSETELLSRILGMRPSDVLDALQTWATMHDCPPKVSDAISKYMAPLVEW